MVLNTFLQKCALPNPLSNVAKYTISLPVRLGGLGLRSAATISIPAYYCSVALAASDIIEYIIPVARHIDFISPGKSQAAFITELDRCWKFLSDKGVAKGLDGLIPLTSDEFWKEGGGVVDIGRSRQSVMVGFLAACEAKSHLYAPATPLRERQRLISSSASNASAWLTVIPYSPELSLSDDDYILAIRHRLGLPSADGLPMKCAHPCNATLTSDASHFHSCQQQKRTSITARHDLIVRTLAKLFRQVGAVVHIEPRIYGSERLRPDMDITFPDRTLMLDVAVTHPASPSRTSSTPLAAAAYTEKAKYTKYTALAARQAATFLPFVLESYGAFGKRANEVLRILRKAAKNTLLALSSELTVDSFAAHAARTLSVALQKGNALIGRRGATMARAAVERR